MGNLRPLRSVHCRAVQFILTLRLTPAGVRAPKPLLLSPDERYLIGNTTPVGTRVRFPLDGTAPLPIKGLLAGEEPVGWTQDSRGIYIMSRGSSLPVSIHRLDPVTGTRQPVSTFTPPDPAGYLDTVGPCLAPDGSSLAATYDRKLGELFVVEGLR